VRERLESLVSEMVDRGILYDDARREFERRFIQKALRKSEGSVIGAAAVMGVHRNTLARKMAEYKIKGAGSKEQGAGR
jgi:DNA-binding NtrC family response regulator